MGSAVEAVAADHMVGIGLIRKRIDESFGGHGLMESSVENSDHRSIGHDRLARADAHQVRGVVKRRKVVEAFNGFNDLVGKKHGFGELLAAVNNAVTDGEDLIHIGNDAVNGIDQRIENELDSVGVVLHILNEFKALFAGRFIGQL